MDAARRAVRGQDSARCEAGQLARRTTLAVRRFDQSEDCQGPRPDHPTVAAGAGGPRHRVSRPEELDARSRRLRAALAAVLVRDNAPELRLVREWLNSWSGIGLIIAGRHDAPGLG